MCQIEGAEEMKMEVVVIIRQNIILKALLRLSGNTFPWTFACLKQKRKRKCFYCEKFGHKNIASGGKLKKMEHSKGIDFVKISLAT